ncbi:unnamed protein product [Caenorhabditis sp. 36 PRJEB53466]|nr:unnamed protein product [Caenorhabditis sp. 36 PRJEB53466]
MAKQCARRHSARRLDIATASPIHHTNRCLNVQHHSSRQDAVEEIDVGVDKHFERNAHQMALVDTTSMFLMDSLMVAMQATKGVKSKDNEELAIDMVRTKAKLLEMKEINLRQDAPRIDQKAASNFVRNALWEVPDQKSEGAPESSANSSK